MKTTVSNDQIQKIKKRHGHDGVNTVIRVKNDGRILRLKRFAGDHHEVVGRWK